MNTNILIPTEALYPPPPQRRGWLSAPVLALRTLSLTLALTHLLHLTLVVSHINSLSMAWSRHVSRRCSLPPIFGNQGGLFTAFLRLVFTGGNNLKWNRQSNRHVNKIYKIPIIFKNDLVFYENCCCQT